MKKQELYTRLEISETFFISYTKLKGMIKQEQLTPTKIGKKHYYTYWQLLILLKKY